MSGRITITKVQAIEKGLLELLVAHRKYTITDGTPESKLYLRAIMELVHKHHVRVLYSDANASTFLVTGKGESYLAQLRLLKESNNHDKSN